MLCYYLYLKLVKRCLIFLKANYIILLSTLKQHFNFSKWFLKHLVLVFNEHLLLGIQMCCLTKSSRSQFLASANMIENQRGRHLWAKAQIKKLLKKTDNIKQTNKNPLVRKYYQYIINMHSCLESKKKRFGSVLFALKK